MLCPVRRLTDGRRGVAPAAGLGALWIAFYAGWLALRPGGDDALRVFANTVYLVPIALATVLALVAARVTTPALRPFWALMALSNALWLAAEGLWAVRDLGTGSVPFPWWTDLGYLLSYAVLPFALY